jgi:hypothetical protein
MAMVIENRDAVVAGTKLTATYKKQEYVCTVEAGEDGKLSFNYEGKIYGSPSSAGTAVIGTACNGWRFWSLADGEATPAAKGKAKGNAAPKASPPAMPKTAARRRREQPKPTVLHKHDNQDDLEPGQTRWVCDACLKHFMVNAYCLAAFEGQNGGWLGHFERDVLEEALNSALRPEPEGAEEDAY